jgi:hypothetical protein
MDYSTLEECDYETPAERDFWQDIEEERTREQILLDLVVFFRSQIAFFQT